MSFKFNWGGFPPEFNREALEMLTQALNKGGNKPPNLVGPIVAKELDLGSNPPQLDILEISELEEDRFRAMFRMKYEGDGFLVLQTQVQANPLRLESSELPTMPQIGVVAAAQPLVVPMLLRISGLKLHGIIVLAVSKNDGITLVFRSDPLVSVEVHSTFDSVPSVRRMLQREIEATLRTLFQEDLPVIVHEMSVNEIRRAREAKERQRRQYIERQQQLIRMRHAQSVHSDATSLRQRLASAGAADAASESSSMFNQHQQHLMASQLHRRLMELSQDEATLRTRHHVASDYAHSVRRTTNGPAGLHDRSSTMGGMSMSGDPQTLEQFLNDDWERTQHGQTRSEIAFDTGHRSERASHDDGLPPSGVVLRPSDNAVAARLASLMSMGQTLSPYTRRFEHTTMRADVNSRLQPPPFLLGSTGASMSADGLSPPMSPGAASNSRQFSFSSGALGAASNPGVFGSAAASTPFVSTTPPLGALNGGRSPYPRNRTLRRKVHRVGGNGQNQPSG
ncbi:ERMES complex subunit [Coemansia asiatica]|uniref:ERMES complex subunit n=1 Tax=Coemansia asiatica TaxID=1052880 RepID=A0A9W7XM86_9FUNG|nr:ERMES complex subunit [Coemansia asiatica]